MTISTCKSFGFAILLCTLVYGSAQAAPPCAGLSGNARRNCLNAEVQRGNQELARIERKNRRLDTAIKVGCTADKYGGAVAGHYATGGGVAYRAGRTVGDKITGQTPCAR